MGKNYSHCAFALLKRWSRGSVEPMLNNVLMAVMPCDVNSTYASLYQMVASQFDWWRHLDASAARNWQCIPAILDRGSPYKYDVHETDKCIDLGCGNLSAEYLRLAQAEAANKEHQKPAA